MRIGGTPDPNYPALPCSEKVDSKINQCPCAKLQNSCVFCDFCKQMRNHTTLLDISQMQTPRETVDNECQCEDGTVQQLMQLALLYSIILSKLI
uniref:Uncharacterized protein n=1 Tax=Setaria digitata TaxID=48799 RepID=A0A915Q0G4_9BILA